MKTGIALLIALLPLSANADQWKHVLSDLHACHSRDPLDQRVGIERDVVGTAGLSWPDGRQALVTTVQIKNTEKQWLCRCTDYFDADMQQTGQACYELRK